MPVLVSSVALGSPMIGPGVVTTGTVTLNQPAPAGGAVVTLSLGTSKIARFQSATTVTIAAGQVSVNFSVQANSVGAASAAQITASCNGASASVTLTVSPGDSLKITAATYANPTLTIKATSTNPLATLVVQNSQTNAILGTMTNQGGGNYSFQLDLSTPPSSVNVISSLGGKTGQGIK